MCVWLTHMNRTQPQQQGLKLTAAERRQRLCGPHLWVLGRYLVNLTH